MSKMTFTQPRATLEETLEFCQRVRKAGGGNPLDALIPAVPSDSEQCLIAKNLNFNCSVTGINISPLITGQSPWAMTFDPENVGIRDAIADELGLEKANYEWVGGLRHPIVAVILPPEIGQVAADFDEYAAALHEVDNSMTYEWRIDEDASPEDIDNLKTFWPYVEESAKETYSNATFINAKGEIVL